MKYGMTFKLDVYDFEDEKEHQIVTTPGDYIRTKKWLARNLETEGPRKQDEEVENLIVNYAMLFFAAKRKGMSEVLVLPEKLTVDSVESMADRLTVYVNAVEDDSLPLRNGRKK